MTLFDNGLKIILFLSLLFFLSFSYVCLMWTNRKKNNLRNIAGAAIVSLLYTFKIVLLSSFLLALAHFIAAGFF